MKKIAFLTSLCVIAVLFGCRKEDPHNPCIDKNKINTKIGCLEIYDPVCGCDNKTYDNACFAENYGGVKTWTSGPCKTTQTGGDGCIDSSKIDLTLLCPENIDFVCGCNGITYSNECQAKRNGVLKWSKGKCDNTKPKDCIKMEVCKDSCVVLKAPKMVTMMVYPSPTYSYKWKSTNGSLSCTDCMFTTVCPSQSGKYILEIYITQYHLNPICTLKTGGNGGNGILSGGCYNQRCKHKKGATTLHSTIEYCIKVKDCKKPDLR
ncbi:MAG: hypothetical protein CL840_07505 [Crocinitomicaceae bacterium]|nr:hypothetical protein [Crocinitomicaceae bacterium]|tara:strand:- start:7130 stop:7918 length:789 start_codon:yes stop_codon:yes gene_type:complete